MVDLQDEAPFPGYQDVRKFPLPSEPTQPFFFRQYTVSEFISPSKQGNVAVKEVSFRVSSSNAWSPYHFGGGKNESLTTSLTTIGDIKNEDKIKSLWATQVAQVDQSEKQDGNTFALPNTSLVLRSKHKNSPASKRMKVDSTCSKRRRSQNLKQLLNETIKIEQGAKSLHWKYVLVISLLPLLSLFCIMYLATPLFENDVLFEQKNMQELTEILHKQVLGQEEPIRSLLVILNSLLSTNKDEAGKMPVILMSGSSGVGKSFVSAIVASNFPLPGKAQLVLQPLPPPESIFQKFSRNGYNLIAVDSLSPNSILDVRKWVQNIFNEAEWQKKPVILILVLNVQTWDGDVKIEDDDASHIRNLRLKSDATYASLQTAGFDLHHIHFNPLTKDHIQDCIRRDLRKRGLQENHIIENYVPVITKNINVKHDGCKPVWSQTAHMVSVCD